MGFAGIGATQAELMGAELIDFAPASQTIGQGLNAPDSFIAPLPGRAS